MTSDTYQKLIIEGIKGLPPGILAEIVDFIYLVRRRLFQPQAFQEELQIALLRSDLKQWSHEEERHLEKEFENYEQLYPPE